MQSRHAQKKTKENTNTRQNSKYLLYNSNGILYAFLIHNHKSKADYLHPYSPMKITVAISRIDRLASALVPDTPLPYLNSIISRPPSTLHVRVASLLECMHSLDSLITILQPLVQLVLLDILENVARERLELPRDAHVAEWSRWPRDARRRRG